VIQRQLVDQRQSSVRTSYLTDGDRPVHRHDGGRRYDKQLVVEATSWNQSVSSIESDAAGYRVRDRRHLSTKRPRPRERPTQSPTLNAFELPPLTDRYFRR
jgi:hypothetical protein